MLPTLPHCDIRVSDYRPGAIANYICHRHHIFPSGESVRSTVCLPSGEWHATMPDCTGGSPFVSLLKGISSFRSALHCQLVILMTVKEEFKRQVFQFFKLGVWFCRSYRRQHQGIVCVSRDTREEATLTYIGPYCTIWDCRFCGWQVFDCHLFKSAIQIHLFKFTNSNLLQMGRDESLRPLLSRLYCGLYAVTQLFVTCIFSEIIKLVFKNYSNFKFPRFVFYFRFP